MQSYVNTISRLCDKLKQNYSNGSWQKAETDLENWKDARNKHEVENYYDEFIFGICYAKKLYKSRVRCFYELMKDAQQIDGITKILKSSTNITSFGCGPGPEIAAYICFIRNELNRVNMVLNFVAMDQLEYWNSFIDEISRLDYQVHVEFKHKKLNLDYVRKMRKSDVCIMSYPHAVKFDNIWHELKSKFLLIIVIDQAKHTLLNEARINGYEIRNFECLGTKTFFYYINIDNYNDNYNDNYYPSLYGSETRNVYKQFCKRGIHEVNNFFDKCLVNVEKSLKCGHAIEVKCYEFSDSENCTKIINKFCDRKIHTKSVICGTKFVCSEIVEKRLICGHTEKVQCCNTSNTCNSMVNYRLNCGHNVEINCRINELIKKNGKHEIIENYRCKRVVEKTLKCGHEIQIKCYERNEFHRCSEIITEICGKKLHKISYNCGSAPVCLQLISTVLNCGHSIETKCGDRSVQTCKKTFEYKLTCGHFTTISCSMNESVKNHRINPMNDYKCFEIINCKLKCGHDKQINCYQSENPGICSKKIKKICSRNFHEEIIECGIDFVCNKPYKLLLFCGHFTLIKCNESDSLKNSIVCKVKTNKVCNRKIHASLVACNENVVCNEKCSKTLPCGHSVLVNCDEFENENRQYCQNEFIVKCRNKLHENKIKCGDESICLIAIELRLFCGDKTELICNDINYKNRHEIQCKKLKSCSHECFVKCVCKIFKVNPNITKKNDCHNESSCGHKYEKFCNEICGKQLICGHFCERICKDCLNGRLHKKCLKSCENIMKCGHKCSSNCHQGNCWECVDNCFINKFEGFSIFNRRVSTNVKQKFVYLIDSLSYKAPLEIQLYMKNLLIIMKEKSHSQFWLNHYKFSVRFLKKIINFYNLILNWEFSNNINQYVDYLHECTIFIMKWLDPIDRNLSQSINTDLICEFKRLYDIFLLLTFYTGATNANKIEDLKEYEKILEDLINIKYNFEEMQNIVDKINFIYTKV